MAHNGGVGHHISKAATTIEFEKEIEFQDNQRASQKKRKNGPPNGNNPEEEGNEEREISDNGLTYGAWFSIFQANHRKAYKFFPYGLSVLEAISDGHINKRKDKAQGKEKNREDEDDKEVYPLGHQSGDSGRIDGFFEDKIAPRVSHFFQMAPHETSCHPSRD